MDIGNAIAGGVAILAAVVGAIGGAIAWGKHIAEQRQAEAETAQTWQEMETEARKRIKSLEEQLATERAAHAETRGRLRALDGGGGL